MTGGEAMLLRPSETKPLPVNYRCHRCGGKDHWVTDCMGIPSPDPPPPAYLCTKCRKPGHWLVSCKGTKGKDAPRDTPFKPFAGGVNPERALIVSQHNTTSSGTSGASSTSLSPEAAWLNYYVQKVNEAKEKKEVLASYATRTQAWWTPKSEPPRKVAKMSLNDTYRTHFRDGRQPTGAQTKLLNDLQEADIPRTMALVDKALKRGAELSPACMVAALHRLIANGGKVSTLFADDRFRVFVGLIEGGLQHGICQFAEYELAAVAWSFAVLGISSSSAFEAVAVEAGERGMKNFNNKAMPMLMWSLGVAGHFSKPVFTGAEYELLERGLADFDTQGIAHAAWAFAKTGLQSDKLFAMVEEEMLKRGFEAFAIQELAALAWAFTTAGRVAEKVVHGIAKTMLERGKGNLGTPDAASLIWVFSQAQHKDKELLTMLKDEVVRNGLTQLRGEELAKIMVALLKADISIADFLPLAEDELCGRGLSAFTPNDISNIMWSFAVGRSKGNVGMQLFGLVSAEVVDRELLGMFMPKNLVTVVWSFATANHPAARLFTKVSEEVLKRGWGSFDTADVCNLAWSFVKLGHPAPDMLLSAREHVIQNQTAFTSDPENYSKLMWAMWGAGLAGGDQQQGQEGEEEAAPQQGDAAEEDLGADSDE